MARGFKQPSDYRRRTPRRDPYDLVLIICEGKKTEPEYFRGLRKACRLNSANVVISPSHYGHDPLSLVNFAIEKQAEEGNIYDRLYCVFDRDGHATYAAALAKAAASDLGKAGKLFVVPSVPCFEIWVLLHFAYSTAAFTSAGNKSACDRVLVEVGRHLPKYQKAFVDVFEHLQSRINTAISNGKRLAKHNKQTGSANPATKAHELVEYLIGLKK